MALGGSFQYLNQADIACPATAELSPSVASPQCPQSQSQVSGEHVQADWSRQGERHCVIVNIAPGIAVKPFDWSHPRPEATFVTDVRSWPLAVRWADTA
jgi:hypothetical protein